MVSTTWAQKTLSTTTWSTTLENTCIFGYRVCDIDCTPFLTMCNMASTGNPNEGAIRMCDWGTGCTLYTPRALGKTVKTTWSANILDC